MVGESKYGSDRVMAFVNWSQKRFGKTISKYGYGFMSKRIGDSDVYFLNFGYEEDPPMGIPLEARDEPDRYSIQLYHRVAAQMDLAGKDVLEVSCGHGGAASYITRTMHPNSYTGLDYNPAGIKFCQRKHQLPGLKFVHGDAEHLPFPDASFDAVINVEAAHLYPDYNRFLDEVYRVLRPGGHFLYADLRHRSDLDEWEADMAAAKLREISDVPIDAEVLRGLEKNSVRNAEVIKQITPALLRKLGGDIGGTEGGRSYEQVKRGELSYRVFDFVKD